MKAVLISIQPPHTTNIFNEIKGIEWRTKPIPAGKQYVYETKNGGGVGKVIGECTFWRVKRYENVSFVPEGHIDAGCVPYEFLAEYSKGKPLYAHFIVNAKRYEKPLPLSAFRRPCVNELYCENCGMHSENTGTCGNMALQLTRPPQSWCHVEELKNAVT